MATAAVLLGASRPVAADPLVFTPRLSVSEEYNDNIFFTQNKTYDFITSITPGFTLEYRQPTLTLTMNASNSSQIYARDTSQTNGAGTQNGSLYASYRASPRLTFTVGDGLTRVTQTRTGNLPSSAPSAPPGVEQPPPPPPSFDNSTLVANGDVLSNYFTAQSSYAFTPEWSAAANYSNSLSDFTNQGGNDLTNTAGLQMRYTWDPELSFFGAYTYSHFSFGQSTTSTTAGTPSSPPSTNSNAITAGGAYAFAQTWSASGFVGLNINSTSGSGGNSAANGVFPTFSATLSKSFEHASALVGAAQGATSSAGVGGVSQTTSVFMYYQQQFTENLNGWAGANFAHYDTSPSFNVLIANVGLSYPLWRYLSAGLTYTYQRSDATVTQSNTVQTGVVDSNIVLLYLTAYYPVQGSL
jgi:hypothetical protein